MAQAILLEDVESLGQRGRADRRLPRLPAQLPDPPQAGRSRRPRARWRKRSAAARPPRRPRRPAPSAKRRPPALLSQDRADDPPAGRRGRQAVRLGRRQGDRRRDARRPRPADRPTQGPARAADPRDRHLHGRDRARRRHRRLGEDDHHRGEAEPSVASRLRGHGLAAPADSPDPPRQGADPVRLGALGAGDGRARRGRARRRRGGPRRPVRPHAAAPRA